MLFAFTIGLIAVAGGAATTYFYDRRAPFAWRLCAGVPVGFTALGLIGYAAVALIGFTTLSLLVAALIVALPLVFILIKPDLRASLGNDIRRTMSGVGNALIRPTRGQAAHAIFYASVAVLWWYVFDRAMSEDASGIYTAFDNNFGDLPFHLGIISGFVHGENFPPQHPEFAGARLTYPFIVDFIAAMFVRAGASLRGALFFENFVLAVALVGVLHRWALEFTRDRAASLITVALVLLSGGIGWVMFFGEIFTTPRGMFDFLWHLPHNYTITPNLYRWGNSVTTLFVPQRSMLLGVPLFLIVSTLWWQIVGDNKEGSSDEQSATPADENDLKKRRAKKGKRQRATVDSSVAGDIVPLQAPESSPMARMIAAGAVAGLLPLAHAHTFGVVLMTGGCLALIFWNWRLWIAFFVAAGLVATPQLLWITYGSATQAGNFIGLEFGWHNENNNALWFWLINTGLFIPVLVAAIYFGQRIVPLSRRALLFYLPFLLCFVLPNVLRLSPWVWDNIKVLFYWYIASAPIVALLVVNLWRRSEWGRWGRAVAILLALAMMLAGTLDIWRALSNTRRLSLFDRNALQFAELVRRQTAPHARILNAPIHNHAVLLTGRRSLFGYPGHLWTHGLPYTGRETDMHRIYAGAPDAPSLLEQYQINYVVVGTNERQTLPAVNEAFFATRYRKVGEIGDSRLYQITNQSTTP